MAKSKGRSSGKSEEYDDRNRGALWLNDKDGNENRPDYTGRLNIDPSMFPENEDGTISIRVAAWVKDSSRVGQYLSLNASVPNKR